MASLTISSRLRRQYKGDLPIANSHAEKLRNRHSVSLSVIAGI